MGIKITDMHGRSLNDAVKNRLHDILKNVDNCGDVMQKSMVDTVRQHFQAIYPGSEHYSPNKVNGASVKNAKNPEAAVDIDVPGITRAYHDITIKPKFKQYLTIPFLHTRGSAADSSNSFIVTNKKGNKFIAQNTSGGLVYLFSLVRSVF